MFDLERGPNREALEIVRAEIPENARVALGHLLRNVVTPLLFEIGLSADRRNELKLSGAVDDLRRLVEAILKP